MSAGQDVKSAAGRRLGPRRSRRGRFLAFADEGGEGGGARFVLLGGEEDDFQRDDELVRRRQNRLSGQPDALEGVPAFAVAGDDGDVNVAFGVGEPK